MRQWLQNTAMALADGVSAVVPQPMPAADALRNCKIISHRGVHDNHVVYENTLPAFAEARANGVWGVECDIRWTADLVPVICHDPSGARLFNNPHPLADMDFATLRQQLPQIPSLAELLAEFGGNTHLMLEIKAEHQPAPERQMAILEQLLAAFTAGRDYHFLVLDPALLPRVAFVPRTCCFLVAELNVARLSASSLALGCGGLTGHYLLLGESLHRRHRQAGQRIGTGFISSRNCLFRELNRGVEWIFSNDALHLQGILDAALAARSATEQAGSRRP